MHPAPRRSLQRQPSYCLGHRVVWGHRALSCPVTLPLRCGCVLHRLCVCQQATPVVNHCHTRPIQRSVAALVCVLSPAAGPQRRRLVIPHQLLGAGCSREAPSARHVLSCTPLPRVTQLVKIFLSDGFALKQKPPFRNTYGKKRVLGSG